MKKRSQAQHRRPSAPRPLSAAPVTAAIEAMGAHGHGVTRIGDAKVFVPFTLPGERARVELRGLRGHAAAIETASPDRVQAACKHFGSCGGCVLQHWREERYKEWKQALVATPLARAEIGVPIEPLKTYPVSSRRRAAFTARALSANIKLGYNAARTRALIDLEECPILLPEIASALPALRTALQIAMPPGSEAKIHVAAAANGLDCAAEAPPLSAGAQAKLVQALSAAGFIRTVWNDEVIMMVAVPSVLCGEVRVSLPPGAFLQAVEACERDMANWVVQALAGAKALGGRIGDLFAGLGAFTFPAARFAAVTAYEENPHAVAALAAAARQAKGLKPADAIRRDLYRSPLGPLELNRYAAVIMDPPREGAQTQARALAASKVPALAMLSCNPAAFARDAAILTGGGFVLSRLAAFDQFRFSPHVEIAALFLRPGSKKGGLAPALKNQS